LTFCFHSRKVTVIDDSKDN